MEASKSDYFIDGFLIRHLGIYPEGFEKDNLFDEQKIFLMYLMGNIPELDLWQKDVSYKVRLESIKTLKTVELSASEITLAQMHGTDIESMKRDRLVFEKKRRISELKKSYGIEEEIIDDDIDIEPETIESGVNDPQKLWDILQGKGLIKNA